MLFIDCTDFLNLFNVMFHRSYSLPFPLAKLYIIASLYFHAGLEQIIDSHSLLISNIDNILLLQVRKLEGYLINYWYKKGHKPVEHPLLPDGRKIIKFDPYDDSTVSG
jgi:hypothetical protein